MGKIEELLIVVLIILLLFGAKKIPELARSIGQSLREVRKGFSDDIDNDVAKNQSSQKSTTK